MVPRSIRFMVSVMVVVVGVTASVTVLARSLNGAASASTAISVESCHGRQLVGAFVRTGIWTGNLDTLIAITNVSNSTCRLGGYPTPVSYTHLRAHETVLDLV